MSVQPVIPLAIKGKFVSPLAEHTESRMSRRSHLVEYPLVNGWRIVTDSDGNTYKICDECGCWEAQAYAEHRCPFCSHIGNSSAARVRPSRARAPGVHRPAPRGQRAPVSPPGRSVSFPMVPVGNRSTALIRPTTVAGDAAERPASLEGRPVERRIRKLTLRDFGLDRRLGGPS